MAARTAGPPQVRNVGTLGGNIGTAAAGGDTLPVLAALEAVLTVVGPTGPRDVPISHLLAGLDPLRPGELIGFVDLPLLRSRQVFLKATGRTGPGRALASVALLVDPAHRVVRCAVGAVAPVPLHVTPAPVVFARSTATIIYTVPSTGRSEVRVKVRIVDATGRLVAQLRDDLRRPGPDAVTWDGRTATGRPASSGIYLAVVEAGETRSTTRFTVFR